MQLAEKKIESCNKSLNPKENTKKRNLSVRHTYVVLKFVVQDKTKPNIFYLL